MPVYGLGKIYTTFGSDVNAALASQGAPSNRGLAQAKGDETFSLSKKDLGLTMFVPRKKERGMSSLIGLPRALLLPQLSLSPAFNSMNN